MRASRTTIAIVLLVALSIWPVVASAHDAGASAQSHETTVPFLVAIAMSTVLSVAIGLITVRRYRSALATDLGHGSVTRVGMATLLFVLGLLALLSAAGQQVPIAIGGVVLGGTVAWLGRHHGVSPHDGCADAAFGAIVLHRTVEGILIAGVYAASAALGLVGLGLLTAHAIGETVAIGGLYAPVGWTWGVTSVVAIHLAFLVGTLVGYSVTGVLSPAIVTALLATVGGVLLATGAIELRISTTWNRRRLEGSTPEPE